LRKIKTIQFKNNT